MFVELARHTGNTHFINALIVAIKSNVTQVILEGRDDDLELIFSCHPHIQEAFTMMDLAEPDAEQLQAMVQFGAERLTGDHGIRIDTEAVAAAIELHQQLPGRQRPAWTERNPSAASPCSTGALASYRLEAHGRKAAAPRAIAGQDRRGGRATKPRPSPTEIARATQEWEQAQGQLRAANRRQREGEEDLARIDWEIADLGKREGEQRTAVPERSFNLMASKGGFKSGGNAGAGDQAREPSRRLSRRPRRLSPAMPRRSTTGCC